MKIIESHRNISESLSRLKSLPLMFVMVIAIVTVHLSNGFEAGSNGFEIPLYYLQMLLTLFVFGPGKISLDHLYFILTGCKSNRV